VRLAQPVEGRPAVGRASATKMWFLVDAQAMQVHGGTVEAERRRRGKKNPLLVEVIGVGAAVPVPVTVVFEAAATVPMEEIQAILRAYGQGHNAGVSAMAVEVLDEKASVAAPL